MVLGGCRSFLLLVTTSQGDAWFDPVSHNQISQHDLLVSLHVMLAAAEVNSALNHQEKFKVS